MMSRIETMMGSYKKEDQENIAPSVGVKNADSPSTNDVVKVNQVFATKKLPPVHPLIIPSSLNPEVEEFYLPPHSTSIATSDSLSTLLSSLSLLSPPFSPHLPPPRHYQSNTITAVVEQPGFINLMLRHNMALQISSHMAIKLQNLQKQSSIVVSSCASQISIMHPKGRMLMYGQRVEVQVEDNVSVKNAKIFPRGICFTANNMALVYLLDEAGARSTSDMFHDLYATNIADTLFNDSMERQGEDMTSSARQLDMARYWRSGDNVDCWVIGHIFIQQKEDGLVIVEKEHQGKKVRLRSSPSNGKIKVDSEFMQVTASLGMESHMFLRSMDRRLHYSGETKVFTVRNAGHSAGFDEEGSLRIF